MSILLQPEVLTAWAALIGALAWPVVVIASIAVFRKPLSLLLANAETLSFFGLQITRKKIDEQVQASGNEALGLVGRSSAPTAKELGRAKIVEEMAERTDPMLMQEQAYKLAKEYESVRASLPPGDSRTRKMEVVVAKMRTIGSAIYPFRNEFMASPSPGYRLLAIASLQVTPDYEALDWLAERIGSEKPFVGYHAAVALNVAARQPGSRVYRDQLKSSVKQALVLATKLPTDTDRVTVLRDTDEAVQELFGQ